MKPCYLWTIAALLATGRTLFAAEPAPRIGLACNPSANEGFSLATVTGRFQQSLDAGVTFYYLSPLWNELEPQPTQFRFPDVDFWVRQASEHEIPLACNIRIVDTIKRSVPKDLADVPWDDPRMRERLLALIDALAPRLGDRTRWVMIGNEIDPYFQTHPAEVPAYARLFKEAAQRVKDRLPGVQVSTTLTFGGISTASGLLRPLVDDSDFLSITYYPLNLDFTFRDPSCVAGDFEQMVAVADGKPILLQEVGYATSDLCSSSGDRQAVFVGNVFDALERHREHFIAASFFLQCDLPDALVNQLAEYYGLPNAERFKAFLQTLGMFDTEGQPKPSWSVFQDRAPGFRQ